MSPVRMDKLESAIRLSAALYDSLGRGDVQAVASLLGDDCRIEPADGDGVGHEDAITGADACRQHLEAIIARHPGAKVGCEELIGFGHRCIARWRLSWLDKDGEEHFLRGVDIIREKDEKIREILSYIKAKK